MDRPADAAANRPGDRSGAREAPRQTEASVSMPLAREEVFVETRQVDSGGVRVTKRVETREETVQAELRRDRVEIERVPIGRVVDTVPPIREDGDTLIVPILEERPVVETRLVLVEEMRIRRFSETETVREPVTLRRERAEVEELPAEASGHSPEGNIP